MLWSMKVMVKLIIFGALGKIPKGLVRGLEELENRKRTRDHTYHSIIKIS